MLLSPTECPTVDTVSSIDAKSNSSVLQDQIGGRVGRGGGSGKRGLTLNLHMGGGGGPGEQLGTRD